MVDPTVLGEVGELTTSESISGVTVETAVPELPDAEPLVSGLEDITERIVDDFVAAVPGAESIDVEWSLTAVSTEVVGIRLHTVEKDSDGERSAFETLWYDAVSGNTADSTELIGNYAALERLASLVAEEATSQEGDEGANPDLVWPIARTFDSLGFNSEGDLVAEFDEGLVATPDAGRIHAVIDRADAEPLLSDLGRRAMDAATDPPQTVDIAQPPEEPADLREAPGMIPPADDALDCAGEDIDCLALTFDDGPGERTGELLDMLNEYDAKATFFVTGGPADNDHEALRRIYAEGHELGNHTMTHPQLPSLSDSGVVDETEPLQAIIRRETGYTPHIMRPPYGASNAAVQSMMADAGMAEIMWSVDTLDWKDKDASVVSERAISGAHPGGIILFHDIHSTTIDAMPDTLEALDEDYTLVTVTQLLGDTEPGEVYESDDDA